MKPSRADLIAAATDVYESIRRLKQHRKYEMKACPHCDGTGRVLDEHALGQLMRDVREAKGLSLREVARRLQWSAAYVSDLENGKRLWTSEKQHKYLTVVQEG